MAAIGTIRKYSGIAIGLIGVSILAFVVSDAFNSNSTGGLFKKNQNSIRFKKPFLLLHNLPFAFLLESQ